MTVDFGRTLYNRLKAWSSLKRAPASRIIKHLLLLIPWDNEAEYQVVLSVKKNLPPEQLRAALGEATELILEQHPKKN